MFFLFFHAFLWFFFVKKSFSHVRKPFSDVRYSFFLANGAFFHVKKPFCDVRYSFFLANISFCRVTRSFLRVTKWLSRQKTTFLREEICCFPLIKPHFPLENRGRDQDSLDSSIFFPVKPHPPWSGLRGLPQHLYIPYARTRGGQPLRLTGWFSNVGYCRRKFFMSIRDQMQIETPTMALFVFAFLTQFLTTIYSAFQISPSAIFGFLSAIGFLWLICWWLKEDSRRTGITWPLDLGMFLYVAWVFIVPYHLFKTRGLTGLWGILSFIVVLFAAWLSAAVITVVL